MKALQIYYTHCQKRPDTQEILQTTLISKGVRDGEKEEIEAFGFYDPPPDAPENPNFYDIENKFPILFKFFRLTSGRYAICQTRFKGRDSTGNHDYFFCHALIRESGCWPFHPVTLYQSPLFKDGLTEQELANPEDLPPLPEIQIEDIRQNPEITYDNVIDFIKNDRIVWLKSAIAEIMEPQKPPLQIIIPRIDETTILWIASLQFAFSVNSSHALTFSTYTTNPYDSGVIINAVGEKRFEKDNLSDQDDLYVIDDEVNQLKIVDNQYVKFVDFGFMYLPSNLFDFHHFLDKFDYIRANRDIERAMILFFLSKNDRKQYSDPELVSAIEFACKYAPSETDQQILSVVENIVAMVSENTTYEDARFFSERLFQSLTLHSNFFSVKIAFTFFYYFLEKMIFADNTNRAYVFKYHQLMLSYDDIKPNLLKSFIEGQTFEEENFQKITAYPPETKELYFLVVIKTLIFLGFDWNGLKDHPQVAAFVTDCLKELKDYQNIRRSLVALTGRNIVFYSRIIRMEKEKKGEEKTEQELSVIMDILKPESRKVWADKVWEKVRETSESENAS